jgi:hypothetical protein
MVKYIDGILSAKNTFNDPKDYCGFSAESDNIDNTIEEPQIIIKRKYFSEIKEWFNENLKVKSYGNGPKERKPDENGYYKCITQFDKVEKVRTIDEFEVYEKNKKWGFRANSNQSREKNKYRVYPVYKEISDKDSLEWWLVYY